MTDLTPLTALGADKPRELQLGGMNIRENSGLGLASVAVPAGVAVPDLPGLTLPGPGRWARGGGLSAFWMAAGQWMIELDDRAETDVAARIKAVCPLARVTEQTDAWVAFEVIGSDAQINALLERLVNIDLSGFAAGRAQRSALHHMGIYVIRRDSGAVRILGMRSSAASLWHAVTNAMQRFENTCLG